ncbi:MAG TPA: ABC transporter permease [Chitinophagales bacterium]|nr:ABC transporter permease [Chitinophagales bacterium]
MNSKSLQPFRFRAHTLQQFKKNKPAVISLWMLAILFMIALLAPLLANERPWYLKYQGENFFPAFSFKKNYTVTHSDGTIEKIQLDIAGWKKMQAEKIIWAPITYSPGKSDYNNANFTCPSCEQKFSDNAGHTTTMPARFRHWLGTGSRGDDLLAGLIHGTRISLTIGFLSMGIATLIGIFLGAFAGYFGDDTLTTTRGRIIGTITGIFLGWFYGFQLRSEALATGAGSSGNGLLLQLFYSMVVLLIIVTFFSWIGKFIGRLPWLSKKIKIHADGLISRLIEIMVSLPIFMLILTVAAISRPSLINLMVIIGLTNWTGIARLTRAEMLRVRHQEFIQSAQALGYNQLRIILRHALPNAIAPALVSVSFGIANAILIESALSFIGLGVPAEVTTWGSLLSSGKGNFDAWWLVVFPGLCIFITVTTYNLIGEGLRDALDPKMKR